MVIANHDIVLSDLSLGGGIILPRRKSPFMFDEGHHVPQKAINHFATSASLDASRHFMSEIFDMVMTMPESYGGTMESTCSSWWSLRAMPVMSSVSCGDTLRSPELAKRSRNAKWHGIGHLSLPGRFRS